MPGKTGSAQFPIQYPPAAAGEGKPHRRKRTTVLLRRFFSSVLPSVRQRQWVRSSPPARQSPKALVFFAVRVLFLRSCLWCAKGNGYSLPLRLAKVQKRWSFSLCGCFFFGLAFGAPKAMGILSPSGSLKSKSMGLFHCAGAFSPLLPSVRQRQWVLSPLRLVKVQKHGSFWLYGFLPPTFYKTKKTPFPAGKGGFWPER